jgi:hypothetical protein
MFASTPAMQIFAQFETDRREMLSGGNPRCYNSSTYFSYHFHLKTVEEHRMQLLDSSTDESKCTVIYFNE